MPKFCLEEARIRSEKFNAELEKKILSDPEAMAIYEQKKREIKLAIALREARKKVPLRE